MKDKKRYTDGYCIGTDANGNDWAWAKTTRKFGSKRMTFYHALLVLSDPVSGNTRQVLKEQFLSKDEAITYCTEQCTTLYA